MKNSRKHIGVILLTAGIIAGLCGCGVTNEKVSAGMQAIKDLDYQSALVCFEEAKKSGGK